MRKEGTQKKILILANSASGLYDFRNELLLKLLEQYEVHVSLPDEEKTPQLAEQGCKLHHTPIDRRGMNPLRDFGLLGAYHRLIKEVRPQAVLTYTIKPNLYGGLCCRLAGIPYFVNITGLGSVFERGGLVQNLVVWMYRAALKKAACVFFQNAYNQEVFARYHIRGKKSILLPGSGVNLDRHAFEDYPAKETPVRFLYVGRLMKEKGIEELLYAAEQIKQEMPQVIFELAGSYEEDYQEIITQYEQRGIVQLLGYQKEMHTYYKTAWAVLMPSYHEGMSNVILEAAATGRPVLASDIPGCREGFQEGSTGFGFAARDQEALLAALRRFLALPYADKQQMGRAARAKMEQEFDRKLVVEIYQKEIEAITK